MDEVVSQKISLSVSDGTSMDAYAARPKGDGPFPAFSCFKRPSA